MANLKVEGGGVKDLILSNKGNGSLPEEKLLIDSNALKEIIEKYVNNMKKIIDLTACGTILAWAGTVGTPVTIKRKKVVNIGSDDYEIEETTITSLPEGYLLCDGSAYSVYDYENLYKVIGDTYNLETDEFNGLRFRVPNLVGRFLEGTNENSVYHAPGLPNITGQFATDGWGTSGAFWFQRPGGPGWYSQGYGSIFYFNASRCSKIYGSSSTVQPESITVRYIIKY